MQLKELCFLILFEHRNWPATQIEPEMERKQEI